MALLYDDCIADDRGNCFLTRQHRMFHMHALTFQAVMQYELINLQNIFLAYVSCFLRS